MGQRILEFALPRVAITTFIIVIIGCAPATPVMIIVPTNLPFIPTETTTIAPTETPIPIPTPTSFNPKATIKIFVHVTLSGSGYRDGTDMAHAAELAVQQLASPLMELGYKIELVSYDDQDSVEVGEANANEIVASPDTLCGVGHNNLSVAMRASEIYHLAGLPLISPSITDTSFTDRNYPELNRIVGRDDGQGIAGAQFAQAQGFTRVYVLQNNSSYSKKNADYFQREARNLGVPVVGLWDTDLKENFEWVLRRVLAADPDLVYFSSKVDQAGQFFREARTAGYTGAFLSTDGVNKSSLVELAGPTSVDGGGIYYTDMAAPASHYPGATKFISDFNHYFGSYPRLYAAQTYDAVGICIKAIHEASKAKGGELPTRKEIANAIRALVDYQGITGKYNFNNRGDIMPAEYFVFKVDSPDPANWDQNSITSTLEIEPP